MRVCPNQNGLSGWQGANDAGAARHADKARTAQVARRWHDGRPRRPKLWRILSRPTNQQRVKISRRTGSKRRAAKGQQVLVVLRHQNLHGLHRHILRASQRGQQHRPSGQLHIDVVLLAAHPVVDFSIPDVHHKIVVEIVEEPISLLKNNRGRGAKTPRRRTPRSSAPAVAVGGRVVPNRDLVCANHCGTAVANIRCVAGNWQAGGRAFGNDGVGVGRQRLVDLILLIEHRRCDVAAQADRAAERHKVARIHVGRNVRHRDDRTERGRGDR